VLKRNMDLSEWSRGIYQLEKGPKGLSAELVEDARIIGIDPGEEFFFSVFLC